MQNGRIQMNIAQPNGRVHLSYDVRVAAARRFCACSLFSRPINAELTMLSAGLMPPPPRLIYHKFYISQDSIDFRVMLFLSCLRAFCLARSVSSRAFWFERSETQHIHWII